MLALLDFANKWVESGGLVVLAAIVFAESGLLVGFFLPGDSLLFFAGFLASEAGGEHLPALPWVAGAVALAAIAGDQVGYMIGAKLGPALFKREESRFFHPENVAKAEAFFAKHGSKTIILARFVPIIRTFAPFVAGLGAMTYSRFIAYNVIGGLMWVTLCIGAGYWFGQKQIVRDHFSLVVLAIVFISILPAIIEYIKHRLAKPSQDPVEP